MRSDKEKAILLRKEGKSFAQISKQTSIPVSTLSGWFKGAEWSKGMTKRLQDEGRNEARIRVKDLNRIRGERLKKEYDRAMGEAQSEFKALRYDPLFVAGMTLYISRGTKEVAGQVRFGSADPELLKLFVAFLTKVCAIPLEKVRFGVFAHPGLDPQTAARFWALGLKMPLSQFVKTMVVPGRFDARDFTYGTCTLTVSSTYLKAKLTEWAVLLPRELIDKR